MVADLNIEDQSYQDEQQWVFDNPWAVTHELWKTQSWRMIGIVQSVSMLNLQSSLPKTPQYD
jgi:hypothetical protein